VALVRGAREVRRLRAVAKAYLEQARQLSYTDVSRRQQPPRASIGSGAGGIAAALMRVGPQVARRENDRAARRLLLGIPLVERARGAYAVPGIPKPGKGYGVLHGPDGIRLLRLVLAARGVADPSDALLRRAFLREAGRAGRGPVDFLIGAAGYLAGLLTLWRATGDSRVLEVSTNVSRDLLERGRAADAWARHPRVAFGHGRAGIFHVLLGWASATRQGLPDWFFDELERLARDAEERPADGYPDDQWVRTWCNGTAGLPMLFARAYEHTTDRRYLVRARRSAKRLLERIDGGNGSICCGLAGRAYALLAMDRIAPDSGWHDRALDMAVHAMDAMLAQPLTHPNGLLAGFPGLACLIEDLVALPARRVGFPVAEG
jgi:serine/threonine-protein kinase